MRRTPRSVSKIGSTWPVHRSPPDVRTRSAARPANHSRPRSSRRPRSPVRCTVRSPSAMRARAVAPGRSRYGSATVGPVTVISPIVPGGTSRSSVHLRIGPSVTVMIRTSWPGSGSPRQVPAPPAVTAPVTVRSRPSMALTSMHSVDPYAEYRSASGGRQARARSTTACDSGAPAVKTVRSGSRTCSRGRQ
nr:hypothetical protein [Actinomadura sp. CNU-125]